MATQKTPEQIINAWNKKPDGSAEKADMEAAFGSSVPIFLRDAATGKVDAAKTLRAQEYLKRNGRAAPGAVTLAELVAEKAPAAEYDVIRRVELFDNISPGGRGERDVDWSGIDRIWKETVAYAVRYGQLPAGATSETVAGALRTGSPPSPWPEIRKEWEGIKAGSKAADKSKVVAVAAVMEGDFSEVATSTGPFVGDRQEPAPPAVSAGGDLRSRLCALMPAQFDEVLLRVQVPLSILPGGAAPQAQRAMDLLRWATNAGRTEEIDAIVKRIAPGLYAAAAPSAVSATGPVRIVIVGHEDDRAMIERLMMHLGPATRSGAISVESTLHIRAGAEWRVARAKMISTAEILLFCASSSSLDGTEDDVMAQQARGVRVVPVLLRSCAIAATSLQRLKPLPSNEKSVASWASVDEAFVDVVVGVRRIVDGMRAKQ